ncbi:MAG TPA: alanine--glyoxylate aminotransferase family protein [Eubacteriaceae bacterium]|mgnify:CR=1 FL=1|jgi:aspartate aminotransferase-like enzyme|nr:alanine--glyoxylate aminotransferase family protein [Eubacteriaceae bacterium]
MFNEYQHLRIPGPTPISPEVEREMSKTILGHRSKDFSDIFKDTCEKAKGIFKTKEDVFIIAASGTGALEMAVANIVEPDDKVLVIQTGVFGERFAKINAAFRANVIVDKYELGEVANPQRIKKILSENPDIKAVFLTHCETSTTVVNPIKEIGEIVKDTPAILIVDSVSGLVGMDLNMDDWRIDIVVTASHKALGLAPGLALISVSQKAWAIIEDHKGPKFYFDLISYRKNMKNNTTPFTGPVTLVFGLSKSLDKINNEGLDNVFRRHMLIKNMLRAAVRAIGLDLFIEDDNSASATVTGIKGNFQIDVNELISVLKEDYKIIIAGGQGDLKGKIFRIGHMGYIHPLDILTTISGLEMALKQLGYPVELGAGIRAAEEVWCDEKGISK